MTSAYFSGYLTLNSFYQVVGLNYVVRSVHPEARRVNRYFREG